MMRQWTGSYLSGSRAKKYNAEVKAINRTGRLHMMAHSLDDTLPCGLNKKFKIIIKKYFL